jgi:pathogenesis-related protein 1
MQLDDAGNSTAAPSRAHQADTSKIDPGIILDEVNRVRSEVGSPPLTWDDKLANTAQKWATVLQMDGCHMQHSTHAWTIKEYMKQGGVAEPLGESLAFACCEDPPKQGGNDVIDMWETEKQNYNYGPVGAECTSQGNPTGEYTQLVWAGTQQIGCGMATCGEKGTVWVCHFFPAGNVVGEMPFCAEKVPEDMGKCEGVEQLQQPESCGGSSAEAQQEETQEGNKQEEQAEEQQENKEVEQVENKQEQEPAPAQASAAPEQSEGSVNDGHVNTVIKVQGLTAKSFDKIVFAGVLAEALDLPLFQVHVEDPQVGQIRNRRKAGAEEQHQLECLPCLEPRVAKARLCACT